MIAVPVMDIRWVLLLAALTSASALDSHWRWECQNGYCQKKPVEANKEAEALSLPACRLTCSEAAALWPKPTGKTVVGKNLVKINLNSIDVLGANFNLIREAGTVFIKNIQALVPKNKFMGGGRSLTVQVKIENSNITQLTWTTDESYILTVKETRDGRIEAVVEGNNFFGVRHGLETLNQLIIYDDLRGEVQMPNEVVIEDKPAYPHRGILLDTSRNYIDVDSIKRTLDGMAASKLNIFHWHITDSHSFPFVSTSRPELSKIGAYSPTKVYTPEVVAELIQYGKVRGVKILPEFDAPAHVGEGWQNSGLVTCLNWQPWQEYCVEPPCGQFDPTKDKLYDVLEDIYGDMINQFNPDVFHMGGDEVNFNCWNSTESVTQWMLNKGWGLEEADFIKLWNEFQSRALERLYKKAGKEIPVIMWTSHLTDPKYLSYLPKDKYVIQIWTKGDDPQVRNLLEKGYKLILSNYEAAYYDCGFAGWVNDGHNWCSPYVTWQTVYGNKPEKIARDKKGLILGSEATLWTEQVDSSAVDSRLWPRAAAMGEALWSEPESTWRQAEQRMLVHRERLISRGIKSDALEPEWCWQNEENCPIGGHFNKKP